MPARSGSAHSFGPCRGEGLVVAFAIQAKRVCDSGADPTGVLAASPARSEQRSGDHVDLGEMPPPSVSELEEGLIAVRRQKDPRPVGNDRADRCPDTADEL